MPSIDALWEREVAVHEAGASVATFAAVPTVNNVKSVKGWRDGGAAPRVVFLHFDGSTAGQTVSAVKIAVVAPSGKIRIAHTIAGPFSISDTLGWTERCEDIGAYDSIYVYGTLSAGTIAVSAVPAEVRP